MSNPYYTLARKCKLSTSFLPPFTPIIHALSTDTSVEGAFAQVRITGAGFLNSGTTFVNFGIFESIPVSFFSSNFISFVVPPQVLEGNYRIVVVNNYNSHFSANINHPYNGNLNFSNSKSYLVTAASSA